MYEPDCTGYVHPFNSLPRARAWLFRLSVETFRQHLHREHRAGAHDVTTFSAVDKLVIDVPQNVANANPRVDDPKSSPRLLSTSGAIPGVFAPDLNANPAGAFLTGTVFVAATPTTPASITPGNRIQVTFNRTGRFLVICQNRGHMMNNHMFGFVNVVGDDHDDDDHGHGDKDGHGHDDK